MERERKKKKKFVVGDGGFSALFYVVKKVTYIFPYIRS